MTASLSPDRGSVILVGPTWSEVFPVARLAARIAFYRGLAARRGGKYARHHAPTLAALESVAAELKQGGEGDGR
ncbi:hypothetical protein EMVG_00057 [Emiliania huxleyi virus PS401]|nr:hypothetical protein EMVG_00057 [Emiliania huxleyi virus PS401]